MPNVNLKNKAMNGVVLKHSSVHNGIYPYRGSKKSNLNEAHIKSPTEKTPQLNKSGSKEASLEADSSDKTISAKTLQKSTSEITDADNIKSADQQLGLKDEYDIEPSLRCGIVIHRLSDGYAARANNIWSYLELNRNVSPFNFGKI